MNNFFIPLLFIIIPGIIGVKFYKSLRNMGPKQKQLKDWQDFIEIFFFAIISTAIYGVIIALLNLIFKMKLIVINIEAFFKKDITSSDINYLEIIWTTIISLFIAFITAKAANKKWLFTIFKKISNTSHYGDEDVWAHFFYRKNIQWIYVRDGKLGLTYRGLLEYFSDSGEKRELVLNNVSVFSDLKNKTDPLYKISNLYLSRDDFDLTIEIPNIENTINKEKKNGRRKSRSNDTTRH